MLDELIKRRSIRKYESTQISDEELEKILMAGEYAPSGMGKQSPYFVALQNEEMINTLKKLNMPGGNTNPFYDAPTVIVVFGDTTVPTYLHDAILAAGNMLNEASSLGLGSCYIFRAKEEFESEEGKEFKKNLGVPDNYEGVANIIVGYKKEEKEPAPRKENYYKIIK